MDDQRPARPGQAVNQPSYSCDFCWDRLPANLTPGILLALAGAEPTTAQLAAESHYRQHSATHMPASLTATPGLLCSQTHTTVGEHP
jgi:hypothetical protein